MNLVSQALATMAKPLTFTKLGGKKKQKKNAFFVIYILCARHTDAVPIIIKLEIITFFKIKCIY